MTVPLLIILLVILVVLAAGYHFYRVAFFPKLFPPQHTLNFELENHRLVSYPEMQTWEKEEIQVWSPYGYALSGYFYPAPNSKRTVILSHGITISLFGSLKYMPIFRKHGFNMVVYDNRYHGRSGGNGCSFGSFEKYDLKAVVDWVIDRIGPDAVIGTHGESLGAAITLQHAAIDPRISFAIADCAFSDLDQLFRLRLRDDHHLPSFPLLALCGWYAKLLLGFDYRYSSPIKTIANVATPILFIHGDQDGYIPPSMSVEMYRSKTKGTRALYLAKGAKHAEAIVVNREEYQNQVDIFLSRVEILQRTFEPGLPV